MGQREVEVRCYCQRTSCVVPNEARGPGFCTCLGTDQDVGCLKGCGLALVKWLHWLRTVLRERLICEPSAANPPSPAGLGIVLGALRTDSSRPPQHPLCSVSVMT